MSKDDSSIGLDKPLVFVDRRRSNDRRAQKDPCRDMPMDLYDKKRRVKTERRAADRTLIDDYYAYMKKAMKKMKKNRPLKIKMLRQ